MDEKGGGGQRTTDDRLLKTVKKVAIILAQCLMNFDFFSLVIYIFFYAFTLSTVLDLNNEQGAQNVAIKIAGLKINVLARLKPKVG